MEGILTRKDLILLFLAVANNRPITPVQLQKGIFLLQEELPPDFIKFEPYRFEPWKWGPYSVAIYTDVFELASRGYVVADKPNARDYPQEYRATGHGIEYGTQILTKIPEKINKQIRSIVSKVQNTQFASLLRELYAKYPDYAVNSVLVGLKPGEEIRRRTSDDIKPRGAILHTEAHNALKWIRAATMLSSSELAYILGVTMEQLHMWQNGKDISNEDEGRILAVRNILKRAESKYVTPKKLSTWLKTPVNSLELTPADALHNGEIDRARFLAVATPSPLPKSQVRRNSRVIRSNENVRRGQEALPPEADVSVIDLLGRALI
ncbi:MAG: hypothetical protein WCD37_15025 [Chloroflexia bacterium]